MSSRVLETPWNDEALRGRLFSEAEDDSDIGLPLLRLIGHGCRNAPKKGIAIDGLT